MVSGRTGFVQFQFFCAGTLIALFLRGRLPRLALPLRLAGFALGFVCWFTAMIRFHVQSWNPQPTPAGSVLGWLLILAGTVCFFLSTLGVSSRWVPSWLAYFGRISYGLYLVHSMIFFLVFEKARPWLDNAFPQTKLPGMVWMSLGPVLVLALSLVLAHLSFRYFERPFLKLKKRFTFITSREETSTRSMSK